MFIRLHNYENCALPRTQSANHVSLSSSSLVALCRDVTRSGRQWGRQRGRQRGRRAGPRWGFRHSALRVVLARALPRRYGIARSGDASTAARAESMEEMLVRVAWRAEQQKAQNRWRASREAKQDEDNERRLAAIADAHKHEKIAVGKLKEIVSMSKVILDPRVIHSTRG
jgi:hypothetical protein